MKKFICLLAGITLITSVAFSQAPSNSVQNMLSAPTHVATDTVSNATALVKLQALAVPGYQDVITIQTVLTKISGTVAATVIIRGSIDGVNYTTIGSDSFTATDVATQSKTWLVTPSAYTHYQVSCTGTGTMSAKLNSKLLFRKRI